MCGGQLNLLDATFSFGLEMVQTHKSVWDYRYRVQAAQQTRYKANTNANIDSFVSKSVFLFIHSALTVL